MIDEHDIECARKRIIRCSDITLEMKQANTDTFRVIKSKQVTVSLSLSSLSSLPSTLSRSSSLCCFDIESSVNEATIHQNEKEVNVLPTDHTFIPNIYDCMISTCAANSNAAPNRSIKLLILKNHHIDDI